MEWIERQIERQRERFEVGIQRWMINEYFDRRQRLRAFRRLIVCQLIYVVMLEWMNWQEYSFDRRPYSRSKSLDALEKEGREKEKSRTSAIVLLVIGLVSTTIVEYLAMIRVGWNNFDGVVLAAFMVNLGAWGNAVVECILFTIHYRPDENFRWFLWLLFYYYTYQYVRWLLLIVFSSTPCLFQIRKSIPGQQHPQVLQLVVWVHQDFCQLFNAQFVANLPPIHALHVHNLAWPTMDEAPRWILKKLSENAATAG